MCKDRLSRGKVDPWQRPFYDVFWVPFCFEALFEFQKDLFKCFFFRRVTSKQSYYFAFNESIFYTWRVGRRRTASIGRSRSSCNGFWHHPFHVRRSFHGRHCDDSLESLVVRFRLLRQDLMYGVPPQSFQRQTLLKLFMVATTVPTVSTLHETLQLLIEDSVAVAKSFRAR